MNASEAPGNGRGAGWYHSNGTTSPVVMDPLARTSYYGVVIIDSIHHVSIAVTDLARARRFYGGVLGLPEIPRPHFDVNGAWYQAGDRQLHLIVYSDTRTLRGVRTIEPRDGHFAFRVRRYQETLDHLRAQGVECLALPENTTPWTQIYVTDPDGNVIELNCDRH